MAGFQTKTFTVHDDYMTPASAWTAIKKYIPKTFICRDKFRGQVIQRPIVLWEAFYGDGASGSHLSDMGFEVIHKAVNFYDHDLGDIVVSNPPFSDIKNILPRLKALNKPFILIMPSSKICTQYFRRLFESDPNPIQIIIPRKRIQFTKLVNGVVPKDYKSCCNFDCFYYCWKINLPRDIVWLKE